MSSRGAIAVVLVVALLMTSAMALPMLGGGFVPTDDGNDERTHDTAGESPESADGSQTELGSSSDSVASDLELVSMESTVETDATSGTQGSLSIQQEDAVEAGVDEGIELAQSQGVEVTQEQRAAALEGARESVIQHQQADVGQVQEATTGAVHGSLMQAQQVEAEQVQYAVSGATDGALAQSQTVSASQMQSATWGAAHGAIAQEQRVTVEQIQVAARGGAAGAASEAGDKDITHAPKIQEAAQGASYGVLEQYQKITAEQRQQITLDHVQNAAAGASAGALEGSSETVLEQEQRIEVGQYQRATVKQIQKAATGAAKGALVQHQEVSVEQTQAAARGASKGALIQVQSISIEQVQRISITQIQEASFGAAKGAISQSQEASVEQIQAAADGAAGGVLVQYQEISITQIQSAAVGAAQGAVGTAIQSQTVEIEQIQAAAFGAGQGAVIQRQVVDVTQVQVLAAGSASGVLEQSQEATVEQLQLAASSAGQETARVVQYQQISITQLQVLTSDAAADATAYAVEEGVDDDAATADLSQFLEADLEQRVEEIDALEGQATVSFTDQERDDDAVVIDTVDLSEGGFVALYDDGTVDPAAVVGASAYLEPGSHSDVEIDLEDPLEGEQSLVAVVHHDTTGDETFQYAETDGAEDEPYVAPGGGPILDTALVTGGAVDGVEESEGTDEPEESADDDEPDATLEVSDQEGDGETLVVDEASADVEFTVTATADDTIVESDTFEAEETITDLELPLEPPLEDSTTVDVSVIGPDGDELATESLEYTLADEEGAEPVDDTNETDEEGAEPVDDTNETDEEGAELATLEVADQTGDGETLTVDEATASVDYALTVTDEDGEQLVESEPFERNETASAVDLDLKPPLETDSTLEVAVVSLAELDDQQVLENETVEYTLEDEPTAFDVEFTDCSQAEVTGSFEDGETVIVATGFYESGGFGNTMGEYAITIGEDVDAPFEGTITYETGDEFTVTETDDGATVTVPEGDFGAAITGVASPDATPGEIDYPNPDAEACLEDVRPELPELSVEETTPTEDGIEVTFGYENPNDAALLVDSEFVEGATADEPVDELEPGQNTFSVEWTPESDDERLVWAVDMTRYDYDADAVDPATTATAGEIVPSEPAEFAVSITETTDSVEQGTLLEVAIEVENVGGEAGTQEIELAVGDTVVDAATVSLEPGAAETLTLTADTAALEPGEYPVTVSSETELVETTVTIESVDEPDPPTEDGPTEDGPTEDPFDEGPTDEPPDDGPTEDPFDEDQSDDPFDEGPFDDPFAGQSASSPVPGSPGSVGVTIARTAG
ncbi:DUF7282 domain-containing protein [Natronorubrum aibiense]|uniref:DUF7282 domain-containing protein n=1 Tax=Natronorubrum aibiense TaxID=348826 RepID=UPI001D04A50A|nr:hypothetical protein [Natronorubrum aibiense]